MAGDIRRLTESDAPLLVEATSAETGRSLWGHHPRGPYTLADARAALRSWGRDTSYGVFDGDTLVAAVGLMPDGPGSAEVAYWVRPEARGRGIAHEAVRHVTDQAHRDGLTRLWLEINPTNAPSRKVAERAGYIFEQRLPRHCRDWNHDDPNQDTWHDCLIWAHRQD
jgi:RimJ/RimL family protein N-acetyltransferase